MLSTRALIQYNTVQYTIMQYDTQYNNTLHSENKKHGNVTKPGFHAPIAL